MHWGATSLCLSSYRLCTTPRIWPSTTSASPPSPSSCTASWSSILASTCLRETRPCTGTLLHTASPESTENNQAALWQFFQEPPGRPQLRARNIQHLLILLLGQAGASLNWKQHSSKGDSLSLAGWFTLHLEHLCGASLHLPVLSNSPKGAGVPASSSLWLRGVCGLSYPLKPCVFHSVRKKKN